MKYKHLIFFLLLFLSLSLCVNAKSGDVAGKYYSTDIVTYLNGVEIDAINIGGETLISAEDMAYYGFRVNWLADTRQLKISSLDHAENGIPPKVKSRSNLPSGSVLGNYYETDIVTYLDEKEITAYNIGGRTYIHAEETRNFGFDAVWNASQRTLKITSAKFGGYYYTLPISNGKAQTEEGEGAFLIRYSKDGVTAQGDADYFTTSITSFGTHYQFFLQFYQNEGLFYSSKLLEMLNALSDSQENAVSKIDISINGKKADKIIVSAVQGNGHRSFYLRVEGIPKNKITDIETITLSIGEALGDEYELKPPVLYDDAAKKSFNKIAKNELDWLDKFYETDEHIALFVKESKTLGHVIDRLYIVNKETQEISHDIYEDLRKISGFNYDKLKTYAISVKDVKSNLFFSCSTEKKNGDFYIDMKSNKLHLISEKDK